MRVFDRLLALVLALILAAVAVVAAIEIGLLSAGADPMVVPRSDWSADVDSLAWDDSGVRITSGVLTGVGALLVLAQVVRRRPVRFALRSGHHREAWISRRSLGHHLERVASDHADVAAARARVGRRRIRLDIATFPGAEDQRWDSLESDVRTAIEDLGLQRTHRVKVGTRLSDERVR